MKSWAAVLQLCLIHEWCTSIIIITYIASLYPISIKTSWYTSKNVNLYMLRLGRKRLPPSIMAGEFHSSLGSWGCKSRAWLVTCTSLHFCGSVVEDFTFQYKAWGFCPWLGSGIPHASKPKKLQLGERKARKTNHLLNGTSREGFEGQKRGNTNYSSQCTFAPCK